MMSPFSCHERLTFRSFVTWTIGLSLSLCLALTCVLYAFDHFVIIEPFNQRRCRVITGLVGSEDITITAAVPGRTRGGRRDDAPVADADFVLEAGIVFVSSDDRRAWAADINIFDETKGETARGKMRELSVSEQGAIYAFRLPPGQVPNTAALASFGSARDAAAQAQTAAEARVLKEELPAILPWKVPFIGLSIKEYSREQQRAHPDGDAVEDGNEYDFHPHGFSLLQEQGQSLLAVNVHSRKRDAVFLFKVVANPAHDAASLSSSPLALQLLRVIRHGLFTNINDLFLVGPAEFYLSNCLQRSIHDSGHVLETLLKQHKGNVLHCKVLSPEKDGDDDAATVTATSSAAAWRVGPGGLTEGDVHCYPALEGLGMPNGVFFLPNDGQHGMTEAGKSEAGKAGSGQGRRRNRATRSDGTLYVTTSFDRTVRAYSRHPALPRPGDQPRPRPPFVHVLRAESKTAYLVDNIERDTVSGDLIVGAHAKQLDFVLHMKDGSHPSPSVLLRVQPLAPEDFDVEVGGGNGDGVGGRESSTSWSASVSACASQWLALAATSAQSMIPLLEHILPPPASASVRVPAPSAERVLPLRVDVLFASRGEYQLAPPPKSFLSSSKEEKWKRAEERARKAAAFAGIPPSRAAVSGDGETYGAGLLVPPRIGRFPLDFSADLPCLATGAVHTYASASSPPLSYIVAGGVFNDGVLVCLPEQPLR